VSSPPSPLREQECELSIVMPCLNEARTVGICVSKALQFLREQGISGEVVVADNGSTDGSQEIAARAGARVISVKEKGYGNAIRGGVAASRGKYIIMGDSDDSYDFLNLGPFLEKLREGYDLVMGNRFKGFIAPGAMPASHRYFGNPVLTAIGRILFRSPCGDFHCGLRGFSREAYEKMDLYTEGMEFASEIVVKASLLGMRIAEVPTTLVPDGRGRPSHLRSWRDGWRHLRFLLLYSPRWLFLLPGLVMVIGGGLLGALLMGSSLTFGDVVSDLGALVGLSMSTVLGFELILMGLFAKVLGVRERLFPKDDKTERFLQRAKMEIGLLVGLGIFLLGLAILGSEVIMGQELVASDNFHWERLKGTIASFTLIVIGVQVVSHSFLFGLMGLRAR
jgi:hypothetical protein